MGDDRAGTVGERGVVLACLDTTAAARPVLETALRLAEPARRQVLAVHVRNPAEHLLDTLEVLSTRAGVELDVLEPPLEETLLDRLAADDVAAGVMGARSTPLGRRPVGRVTRHVIEHCGHPILVVPPEVVSPAPFRRAVVPLEGDARTSHPIAERVLPLLGGQVELVAVHVFTDETRPTMLDRPIRDMAMLAERFLASHLPVAARIEMQIGPVPARVVEMAKAHDADLVVLSWSQHPRPGRAQTVMGVLSGSAVPVLLVPNIRASRQPHTSALGLGAGGEDGAAVDGLVANEH